MRHSAAQELRAIFKARVYLSFVSARVCMRRARVARERGDREELQRWMGTARVLRKTAARWRVKARRAAPWH